jgi:phenylacetate-CoA ligase
MRLQGDSASVWNEKRESMPRAELNEFQLVHLRALVSRLESNVQFYRDKFSQAGTGADKLKALSDLSEFPFTTKADLRSQYPSGFIAVQQNEIRRFHASSGTKGKPTLVPYSQADLGNWAELVARSLFAAGVRPGDIVHNAYGYGLFTGGLGLHAGIELLGAISVPASGGKTQQQITLIQDLKPRVLCSTPSYAMKLACTLEEMGIPSNDLQIGIFGAEPWTNELGESLKTLLQLEPFDIYGLSEIMGPGVAIQCEQQRIRSDAARHLHIWEDHFLVEVIDRKTEKPLPDGEEGELVLTTLQKEAMPLLRFRTGDVTRLTREPCACGRTSVRMESVRARYDDMLIIRGVNVYPSEIERVIFSHPASLGPHYRIIISKQGALDQLAVEIELSENSLYMITEEQFKEQHIPHLVNAFKGALGLSIEVQFLPVGSLERVDGKSQRVVDLRDTGPKVGLAQTSFENNRV